jgi:hypothetical protein
MTIWEGANSLRSYCFAWRPCRVWPWTAMLDFAMRVQLVPEPFEVFLNAKSFVRMGSRIILVLSRGMERARHDGWQKGCCRRWLWLFEQGYRPECRSDVAWGRTRASIRAWSWARLACERRSSCGRCRVFLKLGHATHHCWTSTTTVP